MSNTLGGITWFYNGESMDYCWRESIASLCALCDQVVALDAGSTDGSDKLLEEYAKQFSNLKVVLLPNFEWEAQKTQMKLSHFANVALSYLTTDWYILAQADEVVAESSFSTIRQAIELPYEGFLCRRFNMYGDFNHFLDVPQERKPVSDMVWRLAKTKYLSYSDGESIQIAPPANINFKEQIKIYHFSWLRKPKEQIIKMKYMGESVFGWGTDSRIKDAETFDPWVFFSKQDCVLIREQLPVYIKEWAEERKQYYPEF